MDIPPFSVRIDPVYALLQGRLGIELEVGLASWFSVELIPQFVVSEAPPMLSLAGRADNLTQHSDGLGPLSGASIGGAFWFNGKPFKGYGLRIFFTNYGMRYESSDSLGRIDQASYVERRLTAMFTSFNRFGPFTIATGIGLGMELNGTTRCVSPIGGRIVATDEPVGDCDSRDIELALDRPTSGSFDRVDVNTAEFNTVDIATRLSIGASFD
jgi:hypothetical protein